MIEDNLPNNKLVYNLTHTFIFLMKSSFDSYAAFKYLINIFEQLRRNDQYIT